MNKCPWCGGETESGHTEVSGIGSGCHTLDIWYTICASDNFCGYYSASDEPPNTACTRLETGEATADSESNPAVSSG